MGAINYAIYCEVTYIDEDYKEVKNIYTLDEIQVLQEIPDIRITDIKELDDYQELQKKIKEYSLDKD